jgi:hypothetical protein
MENDEFVYRTKSQISLTRTIVSIHLLADKFQWASAKRGHRDAIGT